MGSQLTKPANKHSKQTSANIISQMHTFIPHKVHTDTHSLCYLHTLINTPQPSCTLAAGLIPHTPPCRQTVTNPVKPPCELARSLPFGAPVWVYCGHPTAVCDCVKTYAASFRMATKGHCRWHDCGRYI